MTGGDGGIEGESPPRWRPLTVLPLIALIFYDVSGGPFGIEDSVRAGSGALLPHQRRLRRVGLRRVRPHGGLPRRLHQVGVRHPRQRALPVLFLDYLRSGGLALPGPLRSLAVLVLTAALTYLNYRDLHLVYLSALFLTAFSLSPFVALTALAIPKIHPSRWLAVDPKAIDPHDYFNSMFWNLNYWDKASTLAGEVDEPRKTFS
ncbi:hypothetical protein QYE76_000653 [Lolium multiflorum]|uniref:Uncharacterized protein n=1 Tax=Lolium multiflorum TaxID=4521 RepID=A0AAD8RI68_LOLMU|nr:hypothetical protein QYE76_000653 [Lolium multiflorum]